MMLGLNIATSRRITPIDLKLWNRCSKIEPFFLKQNVVYVQNDLKQNFIISDSARIIEKLQNNTV